MSGIDVVKQSAPRQTLRLAKAAGAKCVGWSDRRGIPAGRCVLPPPVPYA